MKTIVKHLIPNAGTLLIVGLLFLAQSAGALPDAAPADIMAPSQTLISYQGTLTDPLGNPIDATVTLKFALYDASSGGTLKWGTETQTVQVTNGLFHVLLGSVLPINPADLGGDLWLDITVNNEHLTPREAISEVVRAAIARRSDGDFIVDGSLGIGTTTPGAKLHVIATEGHSLIANGPVSLWGNVGMHDNLYVDRDFWTGGEASFDTDVDVGGNLLVSGSSSFWGTVGTHGDVWVDGVLWATGGVNCGALTEANLQTPEELAAGRVDRFEEGDVLCWGVDQLEKCSIAKDRLVQAVADAEGRPIVIGAELVKVIGPVKRGDILVSSDVPGYAMVNNDPLSGTVIAQALEDVDGEQGIIKAMIRKW